MKLILEKKFENSNLKLEVFNIEGKIFKDYPNVIEGSIFHFTLGKSLRNTISANYQFTIDFHWKHKITGSLDELKIKLENFKKELLNIDENISNDIDQFGYINLFIIDNSKDYSLIISSDTFDVSKLISLI